MKALAIIINFFIPGLGSFFVGKVGRGIAQLILYFIGWALIITAIGAIIGIPLCIGVWIWGLVTAATAHTEPVQVIVVNKNEPPAV